MFNKKDAEIAKLKCRIEELEGRLCPCGSHDWVYLGCQCVDGAFGMGDERVLFEYECRRCGKKEQTPFIKIERKYHD